MKKLFTLLSIFAASIAACDIIDLPIEKPIVVTPIDSSSNFPVIDTANMNTSSRKVFVEEYTGHQCPNCPSNQEKLLNLQKNNSPEVVVVSYHQGIFAEPDKYPFEADYRTAYGGVVNDHFKVSGYPTAVINRAEFPEGSNQFTFALHVNWVKPINFRLDNAASKIALGIANEYDADSNRYLVRVSAQALEDLTSEYRLTVLYIEDSIISAQIDNRLTTSPQYDYEYVHRHLFRGVLNEVAGLDGEVLIDNNGLLADEWVDKQIVFEVPEYIIDPLNCSFIAILVNSETSEVVQVEEVHAHKAEE